MRAARDDDALERDRLDPPIERIAAESHFLDDARERMRAEALEDGSFARRGIKDDGRRSRGS
jgi:hypothetical protein